MLVFVFGLIWRSIGVYIFLNVCSSDSTNKKETIPVIRWHKVVYKKTLSIQTAWQRSPISSYLNNSQRFSISYQVILYFYKDRLSNGFWHIASIVLNIITIIIFNIEKNKLRGWWNIILECLVLKQYNLLISNLI